MNQKMKEQKLDRMVSKIVNYSIMNQYQMRESIKHVPLKMLKKGWWIGNIAEKLGSLRNIVKPFAVMSEAEKHLRITSFTEQTESGIKKAIKKIKEDLSGKDIGYILDIRSNPGGLLDQAV